MNRSLRFSQFLLNDFIKIIFSLVKRKLLLFSYNLYFLIEI